MSPAMIHLTADATSAAWCLHTGKCLLDRTKFIDSLLGVDGERRGRENPHIPSGQADGRGPPTPRKEVEADEWPGRG